MLSCESRLLLPLRELTLSLNLSILALSSSFMLSVLFIYIHKSKILKDLDLHLNF